MIINETTKYRKDVKKKIIDKHKNKEFDRLNNILSFIESKDNLKDVLSDSFSKIYRIEQKKGNLKEVFTAHINDKMRLYMKPIGEYPYNLVEIVEIVLEEVDDRHYGEG